MPRCKMCEVFLGPEDPGNGLCAACDEVMIARPEQAFRRLPDSELDQQEHERRELEEYYATRV